ncbi:MAG TPA: TerC/Alx family metal homeostasis membrane protein [Patescibacteria group bacterium]|nr:TerC/Alx family metal homeostasis membrane protein [Patescibacteria group bacterium]
MTTVEPIYWIVFLAFIGCLLFLDLFVFHREAHAVRVREAVIFSTLWIALGLGFGALVFLWLGSPKGVEYYITYLKEKSLSVDNVFVFAMVFGAFAVPRPYQHRVLFWGVVGALAMRLVLIIFGAALIAQYKWGLLLFGGFLVLAGIRIWLSARNGKEADPAAAPIVRFLRRRFPFTDQLDGQRFWTRVNGRRVATVLLLVLVVMEVSDLAFAVDSIPAAFAVTTDPFVIYTSNAFAILGLRSLYFLVADLRDRFHYVTHGLAIVLAFIGLELLASPWFHLPPGTSLVVIAVVMGGAIVLTLARSRRAGSAA